MDISLFTPHATESVFRRRIVVVAARVDAGTRVRATVEDDFHHFRVEVHCSDARVEKVNGEALRNPYTLCPSATGELQHLVGMPLTGIANAVTRFTDPRTQCTHLLDLAGIATAAAAHGTVRRQYDIEVPERPEGGSTRPRLWRDGALMLEWQVAGTVIEAPVRYAGVDLRHGMARWALSTLPVDEAEAALVLRRCTTISVGRVRNLDAQVHSRPSGNCFAQQPARAENALRVVGSTREFSGSPQSLCAGDRAWLDARPASAAVAT